MGLGTKLFNKLIYLRILLLSIAGALALSVVSILIVVRLSDHVVKDYRNAYLQFLAKSIESSNRTRPLSKIRFDKLPLSDLSEIPYSFLEVSKTVTASRSPKANEEFNQPLLWIVNDEGKILSSNTSTSELPLGWDELPHPKKPHSIRSTDSLFMKPKTFIIRLNTKPKAYLVSHNSSFLFQGSFLWVQGTHAFITASISMFLALSLTFFYLRRKSRDARAVLSRLERGDLKARFKIKRIDELGGLLLDFNRMADKIEGLVKKVDDAETSRSQLLQELGHDVRTPLTSLTTSFDTLRMHHDELSEQDQQELYQMIGADIRYFRDLLEQLTVVANIDVPRYKSSTEVVDLEQLLENEIRGRQTQGQNLLWEFNNHSGKMALILGDTHLITRLFRNAFDNAGRYAASAIKVSLQVFRDHIDVTVTDDGPGLTTDAMNSFGKRRERRLQREGDQENFSLGLGSVIMKAIAEVHDGLVTISNHADGGACVTVSFRKK